MTALAVIVLVIWAIGIAVFALTVPAVRREDPLVDAAFFTSPAPACLITAVLAVGWPGALIAAGLIHLSDRRSR
ncbi:hypothetical protein ACWDHW_13390 [Streptomyces melanosporofaciens]